jgi:hypothetical protein
MTAQNLKIDSRKTSSGLPALGLNETFFPGPGLYLVERLIRSGALAPTKYQKEEERK